MDEDRLDEERLKTVFRALAEYEVEYAVFGAVALGLHRLARATGNLDLFIAPTASNVENLKLALMSVFDDASISEISSEDLCMAVHKYRSVEDVPPPWRSADDPTNLRSVAMMMRMHSNLTSGVPRVCGVRRFRTVQEANEDRGDPYRTEGHRVPSEHAGDR